MIGVLSAAVLSLRFTDAGLFPASPTCPGNSCHPSLYSGFLSVRP